MRRFSLSIILMSTLWVAGCATHEPDPFSDPDIDYVAVEATVVEAELTYRDLPYLEKAFIDATPADRKDGIPVGQLGIDGGNKEMIIKLAREIADGKHGNYDSLLISYKGKLLFESYYLRGRVNLPHYQGSATKSYVSLVVGRAMQLGFLTMADLDKPVTSFLKDLDPTKFVAGVEKITLHKAMTMRSGLRFSEEQIKEFRENRDQFNAQTQSQAFLELSAPITSESQRYKYQSPDAILVMQILDAVVPGTAKAFIQNEFLEKIGINSYRWRNDLSGLPFADEGLSMTSRDMLKLGTLAISNGKWNGEQFISADYLVKATSGITQPTEDWQPETYRYGYFWYQTTIAVGDKNYAAKIAWGGGGQHVLVVDQLDLMIAITGHDRNDSIMTPVSRTILPAFVQSDLEGAYFDQKPPGLIPEVFAPGMVSISGRHEGAITFSPDLDEAYFGANNDNDQTHIYFSRLEEGKWTPTKKVDFTNGKIEQEIHPFVSLDGKRIYFTAVSSDLSYNKIWYANRRKIGWSSAIELKSPVNHDQVFYPNQSADGDLYYFNLSKGGTYYASNNLNGFSQINPVEIEFGVHAFIAVSQDYLLLNARNKEDENRTDNDIYVSFKRKNGTWTKPINLGDEVNSNLDDRAPTLSPDGKYLFFGRDEEGGAGEADIYWVSTKVIDILRPKMQPKEKDDSHDQ